MPSMASSLPATTVERQANNAVMDRLRKDEMYAMQMYSRSSSDSGRRATAEDPIEPSTGTPAGSANRRKKVCCFLRPLTWRVSSHCAFAGSC